MMILGAGCRNGLEGRGRRMGGQLESTAVVQGTGLKV